MNQIILYFLKHPVTALMIALFLTLMGSISLVKLPIQLMPEVQSSSLNIAIHQSGVAAEKIEEQITIPAENILSQISEIEKIESLSKEGEASITLFFAGDARINHKNLEASEKLQLIGDYFPKDANEPLIFQHNPSENPVFIASFKSSSVKISDLRNFVEYRIKPKIEKIKGVSQVQISGGFEREFQIVLDNDFLTSNQINPDDIIRSIKKNSRSIQAGLISDGLYEYRIRILSGIESAEDLADLDVISVKKNIKSFKLGSAAEIKDHFKERSSISRTNGEDGISIYVYRSGNGDTIRISEMCSSILRQTEKNISSYEIYNQGARIKKEIETLASAGLIGSCIASFILYLFIKNVISSFIITLSIPLSFLTSFLFMNLSGTPINLMSLSGLALGSGMMIDHSIVLLESIETFRKKRNGIFQRVYEGSSGVIHELTASALTTGIVFFPLYFSDLQTLSYFKDLALSVIFSLTSSLLISITIVPSFMLYFEKKNVSKIIPQYYSSVIMKWNISKLFFTDFLMHVFLNIYEFLSNSAFLFIHKTETLYSRIAEIFLENHKSVTFFFSVFTLISFPVLLISERTENKMTEEDILHASVEFNANYSLAATQLEVKEIEKELLVLPEILEVSSRIEKAHADLHLKINLESWNPEIAEFQNQFRYLDSRFPDAQIFFRKSQPDPSQTLDLEFFGEDIDELRNSVIHSGKLIHQNVSGIDRIVYRFKKPGQGIQIQPDQEKLFCSGCSVYKLGRHLNLLLSGMIISKIYQSGRRVDVRMMGREAASPGNRDLVELRVMPGEKDSYIKSISNFQNHKRETKLWRKNKRKTLMLTVYFRNQSVDHAAREIKNLLKEKLFTKGITFTFGDRYRKMMNHHDESIKLILTAVLLIYLLLGALYESVKIPLVILLSVPASLFLVIDLYFITGKPLDLSILIGFLLLTGMAVNPAIILTSSISHSLPQGFIINKKQKYKLIIQSAVRRIRPVIITSLTTIFSLIPMILEGSGLWQKIALTLLIGIIFSVMVNLLMVPVLYCIFNKPLYLR